MTLRGENRPKTYPIFEKGPNADPNFEHWLNDNDNDENNFNIFLSIFFSIYLKFVMVNSTLIVE